jgi:hypothetical protein
MSSHSHSSHHAGSTSTGPWIVVAALIAGALAIGGALVAASVVLLVIGVVLVLAGLLGAAVLSRRGTGSLSFTEEYPGRTYGPRSTSDGDSSPPIDTHPNGYSGGDEYRTVEEVEATSMEEPPDDRRVFPQLSNLSPGERLRNVDGQEVIERPRSADEADSGTGEGEARLPR